jgi:hypothetical protein
VLLMDEEEIVPPDVVDDPSAVVVTVLLLTSLALVLEVELASLGEERDDVSPVGLVAFLLMDEDELVPSDVVE